MKSTNASTSDLPLIVRYVQPYSSGIQSQTFSRHAIGYLVHGTKYIYYGDRRYRINSGDMFYLDIGVHYIEDIPDNNRPFEQVMFFYSPELLGTIISDLGARYDINVSNEKFATVNGDESHSSFPANNGMKCYFGGVMQYLRDGLAHDSAVEQMKMSELIYLILRQTDSPLRYNLLEGVDLGIESFKQIINSHLLDNITIEELACMCNRSMTSFKKEFRQRYGMPPHRWFIRQRLMHARLQLIATHNSVSSIGDQYNFPNTSHFIKLFKKEFGVTPAAYRAGCTKEDGEPEKPQQTTATESAADDMAFTADQSGKATHNPREGRNNTSVNF